MKPRQIMILAAILALLSLGVLLRQCHHPRELVTREFEPLDLSFDQERVGKIRLSKGPFGVSENTVELVQDETGWRIPALWNARADRDKIQGFLEEIDRAEGELRGSKKDLFDDFGIGEKEAFHVELTDPFGAQLLQFRIGTRKASGPNGFVRKADSQKVFLTNANLLGRMGIFGPPSSEALRQDFWASTRLVSYGADQVRALETFRQVDGEMLRTTGVSRENGAWMFDRKDLPFAVDGGKVDSFLNTLKEWRAQTVLDPETPGTGLENPVWTMRLELLDGDEIVLKAGNTDADHRAVYFGVSTEPVLYRLVQYYFENMDADDSRFFAANPLQAEPEAVTRIWIQAQREKMEFQPKKNPSPAQTQYLSSLKNFQVTRLLFDRNEVKKAKSPGRFILQIEREGRDPVILDVGDPLQEDGKEYAARLRGNDQAFAVSGPVFQNLFEHLDRLRSEA